MNRDEPITWCMVVFTCQHHVTIICMMKLDVAGIDVVWSCTGRRVHFKHVDWQAAASHEYSRTYRLVLQQLRRDVLHWLDVTGRITFRYCVFMSHTAWRHRICRNCVDRLVSEFEGRRSTSFCGLQLDVPHYRLATVARHAFDYAGPKAWDSLPDCLRRSNLSLETFKRQWKTLFFVCTLLLAYVAHFYVLCNGVRMSHCIKGYLTW